MTANAPTGEGKRERQRRHRFRGKKQEIAERVLNFVREDRDARSEGRTQRIQRKAKLRMWEEDVDHLPWPGASNTATPDIATAALIAQDSLQNAVMSARPAVTAHATDKDVDSEVEQLIDDLLDQQFFTEGGGERVIEEMAQNVVEEGCFRCSWFG